MTDAPAGTARPLTLLIVDDHEVVREGLSAMLDRRPNFQVVAEAGTVAEALDAARRFQPDLVVMDVRLPDGSGVEACREIRAELPATRVVMLTSYPDEEAVIAAIIAGASGYLLKQVRARDLVAALEAVGRGESLLDPAVTGKVLERMRRIATADQPDELGLADPAGAQDPGPRRRGQDEQGDRRRGLPVRQDGQELRQLDPGQAQPRAARAGGRLRRPAGHPSGQLKRLRRKPRVDRRHTARRRPVGGFDSSLAGARPPPRADEGPDQRSPRIARGLRAVSGLGPSGRQSRARRRRTAGRIPPWRRYSTSIGPSRRAIARNVRSRAVRGRTRATTVDLLARADLGQAVDRVAPRGRSGPSDAALSPGRNWSGRTPIPTRLERWIRS